ncbi:MAG: bifunctional phosphoribosylaminoimidazolecarboxamide formyltransferase/IMP cyclohydrolase, partial [Gammaproteobacteria bacterium]|nr:bifunctional phosphoribosylaminoimidazolecarboxamide formyltransferase/IMP cyclohydrolase [Gammaproteobacteria bacterium]
GGQTLGIGAGQTSRKDAAKLACLKAQWRGLDIRQSVAASDAYFPFRDGVDFLADNGIMAVIQPSGSMRDGEVIQAADEKGIILAFTDKRHFRH